MTKAANNRSKIHNKARVKPSNNSSKKSLLPTILIFAIPLLIVTLAIFVFGIGSNENSELGDNITPSSMAVNTANSKTIELSNSLTINEPGVYTLTGTINNGLITINTVGVVQLVLNGVSITNPNGPAIYVEEAKTVIIETTKNTINTLTDGSIYSSWDEDVCGALFSHDDLVLQGSGTLIINANFEDGIVGKDDLKIISGAYDINAKDEGIRGRDSVYLVDGDFEINAGGDAIKSNNSDEVAKGWVKIDGGSITASAGDDGIHAESSLEINGGTIRITKSYEGLEGAKITINGGDISVVASDDGLNAAGGNDSSSPNMGRYQESSSDYAIYINGGLLYVDSAGDGIDSNGAVYVNGGTVVVDGPTNNANGALDSESGLVYNGGEIIAVGASGMAVSPNNSSSKYSLSIFFTQTYSAGTVITVEDSSGNSILEHTSAKSFSHASLSSESFKEGQTYYIYINDTEYTSVTLNGKTTQIGSGGMMGPGGMNPNDMRAPGQR